MSPARHTSLRRRAEMGWGKHSGVRLRMVYSELMLRPMSSANSCALSKHKSSTWEKCFRISGEGVIWIAFLTFKEKRLHAFVRVLTNPDLLRQLDRTCRICMPRKKIAEGGSPNLLHDIELQITRRLTQAIAAHSGMTPGELEVVFSVGRAETAAQGENSCKGTGRQWNRYVDGKTAMKLKTLCRVYDTAIEKGLLPSDPYHAHENGRELKTVDRVVTFLAARDQLVKAIEFFRKAVDALGLQASFSVKADAPHIQPPFASTKTAFRWLVQYDDLPFLPVRFYEYILECFAADVASLHLLPSNPLGLLSIEDKARVQLKHHELAASRAKETR
jgi:hypothetical protein